MDFGRDENLAGPDLVATVAGRSATAPPGSCYRLRPQGLRWRHWDGGSVVYDDDAALTHLIPPDAADVLQLLGTADDALSFDALWSSVCGDATEAAPDADAVAAERQALQGWLDEWVRLGLVETASP